MTRTATELQGELTRALLGYVEDPGVVAAKILDAFAVITDEEFDVTVSENLKLITLDPRGFSGVSVKPGNIRLNWRSLFEKVPELVLTGAGVTQIWLIPFAALYLWNLVWSLSKVVILPEHGTVMYALWNSDHDTRRFEEDIAQSIVNDFRSKHGLQPLDRETFGRLVFDLERLGCIEITNGKVWLREWTQRAN